MVNTASNKMSDSNNVRSDPKAIRQSFRVPVDVQDDIAVWLDNQVYSVVDICPGGVNFVAKDQTPFSIGQLIEGCELIIPGSRIKDLTARIVHSSSTPEGDWHNGVKWNDLADEAQQQIAAIVSTIKQRLRQSAAK